MKGKEMQKTVIAFGETLWDMLPSGEKLGGAPFNFAYRVHSLGDHALIVSRLGKDVLGERAYSQILSLHMDTRFLQRDPKLPTGTVEVTLDEDNNPDYHIVPNVAYDNIEVTLDLLNTAVTVDCICFGTLAQRTEHSQNALRQILKTSKDSIKLLDINLRKDCYTTESIESSLGAADILRMNEDEAEFLAKHIGMKEPPLPKLSSKLIERYSLTHCLTTLGDRGAFAASAEGEMVYAPGYKVDLVDPCGSGDAFTAGFIFMLLRNSRLASCCQMGNILGALVATQAGATEPVSSKDTLAFHESDPPKNVDHRLHEYISE